MQTKRFIVPWEGREVLSSLFAGDLNQAINHDLVVWSIIENKQMKVNILTVKTQLIL